MHHGTLSKPSLFNGENVAPQRMKRKHIRAATRRPTVTLKEPQDIQTWLHKRKIKVLEWSTQSSDLSPTENLWNDLKELYTGNPLTI